MAIYDYIIWPVQLHAHYHDNRQETESRSWDWDCLRLGMI